MRAFSTKHFLTGEELSREELHTLIDTAIALKHDRSESARALQGKTLALLFEKPSLRTRFSFTVAMQELGGSIVEAQAANRKDEEPEDVARVLEGYVQGVMLRTHGHDALERMSQVSHVPIINGLSDSHHPCQALADLMTLKECFPNQEISLAYVGDGNNVLHSILLLLPFAGVNVNYSCPKGFGPDSGILQRAHERANGRIQAFATPEGAVKSADAIYTDVWTSMGQEGSENQREKAFEGFQLNEALHAKASPGAKIMHCLPMVRNKEITASLAESPDSVLFRQSENRLHVQKALLLGLMAS